jgi:hypothetical protein
MEIAPAEVDEVLLSHPAVDQAVTFPVPDAKFGECVAVVVVLRPGAKVRPRDLKWFAFTHLASHKIPQRIVMLDSIPRVARRALARLLGFRERFQPSRVFPIQPDGIGEPLFVIGDAAVRSDRPVFGIREPDPAELPPPHTLEHAAAECVHALRRFQPEGPYALAASEASRSLALEMARQIEQTGERIEFVALVRSKSTAPRMLAYDRRHSWTGRTVNAGLARV